jgi:hypothetical protein
MQTQSKHTPGPWQHQLIAGPYHQQILCKPDCRQIAMVRHWPDLDGFNSDESIAETDANARLIAAAPELLEALVELGYYVETYCNTVDASGYLDSARAAISRATSQP